MLYKVIITFNIDSDDYEDVNSEDAVKDLVNAMIEGEADWPRQFGEKEEIKVETWA